MSIRRTTTYQVVCDGCGDERKVWHSLGDALEDGKDIEVSTLSHLCTDCKPVGIPYKNAMLSIAGGVSYA